MKLIPINWQPKLAGWLAFVSVAATQINYLFDGIAETNPDYNLIVTALLVAIGLNQTRQANKSSEDQRIHA